MAQPWERLHGESAKAFEAFVRYRDMGPERSLAKVARELGKSTTIIERWSARDSWVQRVAAWEEEQDRIWRDQQVASRREVGRRQLRIANAMQAQLVQALTRLDLAALSPRDLGYWLDISTRVQRQALGLGEHVAHTGADGGPIELARLSPDEARARLREVSDEISRRLSADPDVVPLEGAL
jgi:hypothetical protein